MPEAVWLVEGKLWENAGRFYVPDPANPTRGLELKREPRVPMFVKAWFLGWAFIVSGFVGASIGDFLNDFGTQGMTSPTPLRAEDKVPGKSWIIKMQPADIELRILSREEFDRQRSAPDVLAYTYITRKPCRIVVPAEWQIHVEPSAKRAWWVDSSAGNVLAHEILHCILGRWHPES